jgi:hypothetical protein
LSRQNRSALGCPLNLVQLEGALRILARRAEQKFGVDLYDSEKVVELVGDEAGSLVRFFECMTAPGEILILAPSLRSRATG